MRVLSAGWLMCNRSAARVKLSSSATPGPDSKAAAALLAERFRQPSVDTVDLVWRGADGARDATALRRVESVIDRAERLPGVRSGAVASAAAISADGTTGLVRIPLAVRSEEVPDAIGKELVALARRASTAGTTIAFGGSLMVAVFGAFALGDDVGLKLIGVGLAAAVLVDATIVRMLLVPAVMQLLGDGAWWMPRPLERLLPGADLEPAAVGATAERGR
jgi:hypothetical protein